MALLPWQRHKNVRCSHVLANQHKKILNTDARQIHTRVVQYSDTNEWISIVQEQVPIVENSHKTINNN